MYSECIPVPIHLLFSRLPLLSPTLSFSSHPGNLAVKYILGPVVHKVMFENTSFILVKGVESSPVLTSLVLAGWDCADTGRCKRRTKGIKTSCSSKHYHPCLSCRGMVSALKQTGITEVQRNSQQILSPHFRSCSNPPQMYPVPITDTALMLNSDVLNCLKILQRH